MITLKVDASASIVAMREMEGRVSDMRPILRIIAQIVRTSIVRNFEVGGRPSKWKVSRRAAATGGITLSYSGRLKQSIAGAKPEITATTATIGTSVVYAGIHQSGGRTRPHVIIPKMARALRIPGIGFRRRVNHPGSLIPPRPFMMVQEQDWKVIKQSLLGWIISKRTG